MARLTHILLTILVLAGSMGVVFNKHYCQGELRSQALYLEPESCHTKNAKSSDAPACPFHSAAAGSEEDDNGCCDNRSTYLKMELPQWHTQVLSFLPLAPVFLSAPFAASHPGFVLGDVFQQPQNWAFDLPPPKYGLRVLLQIFRI